MWKFKTSVSVAFAALVLVACATTPPGAQSSDVPVAPSWNQLEKANPALAMNANAEVDHDWWRHFGDPTLDALITEAIANNKSLQIAVARIEEARANRGIARSRLFPEVTGGASAQRGNQGFQSFDQTVNAAQVTIDASWEVDLFGRNQARTAEAGAILQSEEAAMQAVQVALLAEVARNYFDVRNFDRQLVLTQQNLETQQMTLSLIQAQFQGGFSSDFDVQRAAAQVSTTEAQIPVLRAGLDAAVNRLNTLVGLPPGSRDEMIKAPQSLRPLDPQIVVAAPATVLAARPDVRAAERRFASSISAKDAATADLFPTVSLTAFFGLQGVSGLAGATPWGIGAGLIQPILNFGRIESQIDAADARQRQAFLDYQKTVLESLEDMETALSSYVQETTRNSSLTSAVAQDRRAAELAQQQYLNGFTSLLDVLVAQRDLLAAEANQAASDAALRKNLVAIYTAAGGGWQSGPAQATP
jgi:NodT family efflux transporter outer membrane factor (OMF) lipoprotein